jgi:hypothetical protein
MFANPPSQPKRFSKNLLIIPVALAIIVPVVVLFCVRPAVINSPAANNNAGGKSLIDSSFTLSFGSGGQYQKEFPLAVKAGDTLNIQTTVDSGSFQQGDTANFWIMSPGGGLLYTSTPQYSATQSGTWTAQADGNYTLVVTIANGDGVQVHLTVTSSNKQ